MKDLLHFDITVRPDGQRVRYRMRHRKRDGLAIEFDTPATVRAADIPALIQGVMKSWANKYAAMTRKPMTPAQRKFYDAVVWFYKQEGRPPSYEEQTELLGCSSRGTPWRYVHHLVQLGWIWKDENGHIIPCDIALPEFTE